MTTFIVSTENFIAKAIACKALKQNRETLDRVIKTNTANNTIIDDILPEYEATCHLYRKASMNKGKIVIANMDELVAWRDAIKNYKPANTTESKVYRVLAAKAVNAVNIRNRIGLEA